MSISVLLDQNIPPQVCDFVRERKPAWNVEHVNDVGLKGAPDESVFRWAQAKNSIVITFDEDFADARMYPAGRDLEKLAGTKLQPRPEAPSAIALIRFSPMLQSRFPVN